MGLRRAGTRVSIDQALSGGMTGRKGRGHGPKFISKWRDTIEVERKGKDKIRVAKLDVLLASPSPFIRYWTHQVPVLVEFKKRDAREKESHVWAREWMCLESEDVLTGQNFRDEGGAREHPPEVCPLCLLNEWARNEITEDRLDPLEKMFVFEHRAAEETVECTVGGFCGHFDRNFWEELEVGVKAEKDALQKAGLTVEKADLDEYPALRMNIALDEVGLRGSTAWRESLEARSKFLFQVVDFEDPDSGVQIARESTALGNAVEAAISHEVESVGQNGHPYHHPYVVRFKYFPDEVMSDKYDAVAMRGPDHEPSEQMVKLVQEGPYPDVSKALEFGNVKTMRAWLESSCQLDGVPWDDIFGPAEAVCDANGVPKVDEEPAEADEFSKGSDGDDRSSGEQGHEDGKGEEYPEDGALAGNEPQKNPEPEQMLPCDDCGKPMPMSATKCENCGATYGMVEQGSGEATKPAEPTPEPTKAGRKGNGASSGKAGAKASPKVDKAPAGAKPTGKAAGGGKFKL